MDNKNSMSRAERLRREKVTLYSIRKYSFGAASVAVAALFMFLGNGAVSANELSKQDTPSSVESTPAVQPILEEPTVKPAEATTPALNKTQLESYISEIETKLSNGSYDNKTEESVAVLKADLEAAKATLANATTQAELKQAYNKLVTTVNSKLKNKPVEQKETPAVDTTEGKATEGKKAENTEKNPESNSIENTGSNDSRNGKVMDKENALRTETTKTVDSISYTLEFSDDATKEIYLYNEEETNVDITVNSLAGKITKAGVKGGSGQYLKKGKKVDDPLEAEEIDGWGWTYHSILEATQGPATVRVTGKPNEEFKKLTPYTKQESQHAGLGDRYLQVYDESGAKIEKTSGKNASGYFRLVVKSQTYKYDIQPVAEGDKVAVADINNLTAPDITKIKEKIKIQYSDKATTQDARLASHKGEVLADRSSVVKDVAVANGTVTVTYNDDSVDTTPVSSVARTNQAPTVEIPYSDKANKEVYVYGGEENSFDIKFKDDSGKIASATVRQGGNREFDSVAGETNKISTQYGYTANTITAETPATEASPAVITYRGTPAPEGTFTQDKLDAATRGENPPGVALGWRYATATDADGALIENKAVGSSTATDPGAFRVMLKGQTQKYDIATPTEKVTVADPSNVTDDDFAKIKEKVQLEYSQTNDDANLADKKGTPVADKDAKIKSVEKDGNNLVVTYKDGSQDKKPLSEFVNVAPKVELPYSNEANKQIYVYTGENTDLTFKATDNTAVKDMYVRGPGGIGNDNTASYGFTTGKIENSAVTHGDGTVSGPTATIKMTGVTTLTAPNRWTSFVVANDNDNAPSNTDFNALDKNPNATQTPGYVQFIVKNQTSKYDIAAPTEKVVVTDPANVTDADLDKIKEKLRLEYNKNNDDANISKDSPVTDKDSKIKSVTKDADGNLVVTYKDGSTDKRPLSEFVTLDKQPAIDAVEKAAEAQITAINNTPNATDAEKTVAIAKVNADKEKALAEIAKPEVTTKEAVDAAKNAGTTEVAKVNPVAKEAAKKAIADALKAKEAELAGRDDLTNEEKEAAKAEAKKLADAQLAEIAKQPDVAATPDAAATAQTAVDGAKDKGVADVTAVNPAATKKPEAKKAVDAALKAKEAAIDARTDLTDDEKKAAKDLAKAEADKAKTAIEAATTDAAVDTAQTAGTGAVEAVTPVAKAEAKKAIADALKAKEAELAGRDDLTNEEKEAAKAEAKKLADAQLAEIAKQPDVAATPDAAATAQTAVDGAKDKGVADVTAVNPEAKAKPEAKQAIDDALKAKEAAIDARPDLTDDEKKAAKDAAKDAADKAKAAIDAAPSNAELEKAKEAGTGEIAKVNPVAKEAAKQAVADELAKKEAEIAGRNDLTEEEKTKAKEEAQAKAKEATDAIDAQPSNAATPEAAATAQTAVDGAKDKGVADVTAVNPAAAKKPEAKQAIDDALKAKEDAIDARPDLTDDEKKAAKDLAKAEADKAKTAIDAAPSDAEVDKAKEAGTGAVEAINPEAKAKPEAKKAIDAALKAKEDAIDARTDLTDDEKKAAKNLAQYEAAKAKEAIDDATSDAEVEKTQETGKKTVESVTPIAKAEAYKSIYDALKAKEAELDGRNDLTDEEKAKAKYEALDKATKASNSIAVQPDVATTPEEAATAQTAVDGAKDKGVADVTAVNPEAKAKPEAKQAIDDALKAKEDAIDARPDLTDDEKKAAKDAAKDAADKAKAAIDAAPSNAELEKAKEAGTGEIAKVNPVAKEAAKQAVADELAKKEAEIAGRNDLTDEEKAKAKEEAQAKAKEATDAIDAQSSNAETPEKAAEAQTAVDGAKDKGVADVTAVNPEAKAKPEAKQAIDDALKAKEDAIDARPDLTDDEKKAAKDAAKDAADKAKAAIDAAPSNAELEKAKEAGTGEIAKVNPVAKEAAKQAVADELAKKEAEIAGRNDLTDEEKAKAKEAAQAKAKEATDAINEQPDNAETPEKAAEAQTAVDGAKDKGVADVKAVNPVAKAKPEAKKAIDDKLAEQLKEIANTPDATDDEKKVAADAAKALADAAKKEIDKAGTDAEVKKLQDEAEKEIEKSVPVVEDKPNARKAIEDEAKAKKEAIDARTDLTPKAKEDLKAQVDKIAEQAKKSVDAAKTAEAVDGIEESDKAAIKAVGEVNIPADKVLVNDPSALTDDEKAKVLEAVKKVNPDAKEITQDADGNVTVTTPDGHQEIITPEQVVKTADTANDPKAGNDVVKPADKVVVNDPAKLTDAEKEKIKAAVEAVNPNSIVVVDDKGNAKVSTPDGQTQVIPVEELVRTVEDTKKPNAGNDIVKPADKVVVDPAKGVDEAAKTAIADKVKAVNPDATVVVDDKGNATVTTPEGKTATIPAADVTKSAADAGKANAGNAVNTPAAKVEVKDPANLTDAEKKAIEDKVKAVNPGSKVVVDDKGNVTVTTPEGKTATIPAADVTKSAADAGKENAGNGANTPATKTVVKDPANLTDEEKAKVKKAVEAVNPGATVVVDDEGNATVTKGDGTVLVIPELDLVIPEDKLTDPTQQNGVNTPATRVLVGDKAKLTADEIEKVKESIKAVNPGATVVVDENGNATVTTPEGKTATIPAAQLVKDAKDVAAKNNGENINVDFEKETVADFNNLTDAEKEAAKAKIKGANADVVEVIFDKAGNATVITKDGKVYTIAAKDIFKQRPYVPSNGGGNNSGNGNGTSDNNGANNTDAKVNKAKLEGAIRQLDELIMKESAKLDAETAKEANALSADAKKVFANADASQAEVDTKVKRIEDFMAKVSSSTDHETPANDQSAQKPAVAPATAQAAANADQTASAQVNARKTAKELPNTGTADSTVAMVAAAASALLGLGLAGRRRKEDEEA